MFSPFPANGDKDKPHLVSLDQKVCDEASYSRHKFYSQIQKQYKLIKRILMIKVMMMALSKV